MTTRFVLCWLFCLMLLGSCAQPDPTPEPTDPPTTSNTQSDSASPTAVEAVATATAAPTAVPPTPTPEPIVPQVATSPQLVNDAGIVTVDYVLMAEDGWVALFSGETWLAASTVEAGETRALEFTVDPLALGDDVRVVLFEMGEGDFSAETTPRILVDNNPVEAPLAVELQITRPQLIGIDQMVLEDGIARLTSVVALKDGWLVAYNDNNGELGEQIGIQWIYAGVQENVPIPIAWRSATPTLHVVLHEDGGEAGMFDPATDTMVSVGGEMVSAEFNATYPPDIAIINQPVVSDTIMIDRVISDGPGWIAIYFETEQEQPGNIIGFAPLVDGVNTDVAVEVVSTAVTPILYAVVHADDPDTLGEFDFPTGDQPVTYDEQIFTFPFATDTGNYVLAMDQAIDYADSKARITVPLVVADVNVFAVVRADLEGLLGDVIGHVWLPAGISRDVVIEIDAEQATERLFLAMHIDRDQLKVLEYPDGRDFELQRRFAPVAAPFFVLAE